MQDDYQAAQLFLDALTFIAERWEFLVGLLLGGGGTYTTFTLKKKHKTTLTQKGAGNQGTQVVDSPEAEPQTAQRDALRQEGQNGVLATVNNSPGATVTIGAQTRVGTAEEILGPSILQPAILTATLDVNQAHILQKIQEVLTRQNSNSTFAGRYQNAISHLNNNSAQVCASEYHAAFLDVVPILRDRTIYGTSAPLPENLNAIDTSFLQIRTFMNSASHDHASLRAQIRTFEDGLMILLGYL